MTDPAIAVAQAPSTPGDVARNTEQACSLVGTAAKKGAQVVALPELFLSGYAPQAIAENPDTHVVAVGDAHCTELQMACRSHSIAAIVGAAIATERGIVNGALVIAPDGAVLNVYEKVHLWGEEAAAFVAGRRPVLIDLNGFKVGLAICFDAGFPEHVRGLARAGASVVLCPAAFALGEERHRYETYYPARALENTLYVGVANAAGIQGGMEMFGDSLVCGPRGHECARAEHETAVETVSVDPQEIERARKDLPYLEEVAQRESSFIPTTIDWR